MTSSRKRLRLFAPNIGARIASTRPVGGRKTHGAVEGEGGDHMAALEVLYMFLHPAFRGRRIAIRDGVEYLSMRLQEPVARARRTSVKAFGGRIQEQAERLFGEDERPVLRRPGNQAVKFHIEPDDGRVVVQALLRLADVLAEKI